MGLVILLSNVEKLINLMGWERACVRVCRDRVCVEAVYAVPSLISAFQFPALRAMHDWIPHRTKIGENQRRCHAMWEQINAK